MPNIPLYSLEAKEELENEYGDETTAVRIAATEMDGANETNGTINSSQTHCEVLNYDEDIKESKGAKDGKKKCSEELSNYLQEQGFSSVEDWIAKNSK